MARMAVDRVAQRRGPAGAGRRAAARRAHAIDGVATIGFERRGDTVVEHPFEHGARIECELELQQLLPHLFLSAAQDGDIVGEHAMGADDGSAEGEQFVDRGERRAAAADDVAEVDKAVAGQEARGDFRVHGRQPVDLAMHRGDGPGAPGAAQDGDLVGIDGEGGHGGGVRSSGGKRSPAL